MSSDKKTVFFLVGNFGVGKSSIIKRPIKNQQGLLIEVETNVWVLGTQIIGADSLSHMKKDDVWIEVERNTEKNIIVTGNYYSQIVDVQRMNKSFKVVVIYLKTSFQNNAKRIAKRGRKINVDTFNNKQKTHRSLLTKVKNIAKTYIIDNNRELIDVRKDFERILQDEKG